MGNIYSIRNALTYLGGKSSYSDDKDTILSASHIILPGVGSYRKAMGILHDKNLVAVLNEAVYEKHIPLLGICLGMQLLGLSSTEHGFTKGLGFINCAVDRFVDNPLAQTKIPHVGFNNVECNKKNPILLSGLNSSSDFYFTHSYRMEYQDDVCSGYCINGEKFTACAEHGKVFGTQFHPEKSQVNGLKLLINFLNVK